MFNNKIKFWAIFVFVVLGVVFIIINFNKERKNIGSNFRPAEILEPFKKEEIILKNEVIVEVDEKMSKINVDTGEVMDLSEIEKNNFSDFSGLPKQGDNGKNIEQNQVIFSRNKNRVIVGFIEDEDNTKTKEYICDISQKKCEPSEILSQSYQGLDIEDENYEIWWSKWDSRNNLLFGYLVKNEMVNVSPIYVCNTIEKNCQKTENFNSKKEIISTIPEGAFSPSLEKFAIVNQQSNSDPKAEKKMELLIFSNKNLSKPLYTYDITTIMDKDSDNTFGDVRSISWSQDEKFLAIGTEKRIFYFDLEKNSLSLAYIAPTDENGDSGWNSNALFLSLDGRYVVFADEEVDIDAKREIESSNGEIIVDDSEVEVGEKSVYVIGVLKKIDLKNNNSVSELLRGYELSLEMQ